MQPQKPKIKPKVINPFEQSFETVKQQAKEMLSPTSSPEQPSLPSNFSKMDFDKLNTAYAGQDQTSIDALRDQLPKEAQDEVIKLQYHRRFKREEEEYYLRRKQEEEEKKRQEEMDLQEKLQQEHAQAQQTPEAPKGKVRKNIFGKSSKKADLVLPAEVKPGGGKQ